MNRSYRVALFFGALPLVTGIAIFLAWWATGAQWLALAGLITIGVGLAFCAAGVVALILSASKARDSAVLSPRRRWGYIGACAALLFSNFPVAFGLILAAAELSAGSYTVTVENRSREDLKVVTVLGAGCHESFGLIAPGETVERTLKIKQDGSLEFSAVLGTTIHAESIDYASPGVSASAIVTFDENGELTVHHPRRTEVGSGFARDP